MSLPKPIPKRLFQAYALALLLIVWVAAIAFAVSDAPPVVAAAAWVGRALVVLGAWIVASLVWMVLVIPVRLFTSGFDTLDQTLARTGARDLREAVAMERSRLDRARTGPPEERLRRDAMLAVGGGVVTFAMALGVVLNLSVFPERIYLVFPVGALVSACLTVFHGARALYATLRR